MRPKDTDGPAIGFAVVGAGTVGLSLGVLLAAEFPVTMIDVVKEKIDLINARRSPVSDKDLEKALSRPLNIIATDDLSKCAGAEYVIIATPTNYDPDTGDLDTRTVESVIKKINSVCRNTTIVIKSTIPIGFVERIYSSGIKNVLFSPEFLREGRALYDNLYPSRIVMGVPSKDGKLKKKAEHFADILRLCSLKKDVDVLMTGSTEAEAIKLFSNSYLALRISYFNELDTFAELHGLRADDIIKGVCLDPRIGDYYNNPSFGYGGYCLPKDSKQLLSSFGGVPERVIGATVESNRVRKDFVAEQIIKKAGSGTVGIFRLTMKSGSDNFRESSVLDVIDRLKENNIRVIIFEPVAEKDSFNGCPVINDLHKFKEMADIIVANRVDDSLRDVRRKVYTRDIFARD